MNPDTKEARQEKEMLEAFEEQSRKILCSSKRFLKQKDSLRIGFESEVAIIKEGITPAQLEGLRDSILQDTTSITGVELGASQIEIRTPPIDIMAEGFGGLANSYLGCWETVKKAVHRKEAFVLRIGSNPFLPVQNSPRTNLERYHKVPDFHRKHQQRSDMSMFIGCRRKKVDVGDPAIVSLFSSFQVNLEAKSFEDAVDKMNRALMIGPFISAISGNARYLELQDTGMQDVRMIAWEMSHDTRTFEDVRAGKRLRVGLPEEYFFNLEDYFNRIKGFPFILYNPGAALQIGIGLHWLDTRVKLIDDSAVVEFRLTSTQPTIEEELGLTLFFLGRLLYSQAKKEQFLPMELVEINRMQAMSEGLHGELWFLSDEGKLAMCPAKEVVRVEIQRAIRGLRLAGIESRTYLNLITERLVIGSPSDKLGNFLYGRKQDYKNFIRALRATKMLV